MGDVPPEPPFEESSSSSPTPAGRLLVQFFVIPLFVVGVAVFVFWLFGAIAVDRKNAADLLNDVRTGSRNQRWQSAFELTKKLPALTDPKERAAASPAVPKLASLRPSVSSCSERPPARPGPHPPPFRH